MTEKKYDLAGDVIGAAMKVHRALGAGYLESVYVNALAHELEKAKIASALQSPLQVRYDGVVVGNYIADLIVVETLIVEVKAVQSLVTAHEAQLVNYLTTTGIDTGLVLNFGGTSLEFRRKSRQYRSPNSVNFVNSV